MSSYRKIDLKIVAARAMERYGFQSHFPRIIIREIKDLKERLIINRARRKVKDLRSLLWSSIDNVESLDIDQIEYCESRANKEILIKVAIADVDAFVPKNSYTDQYAANNATSVYTGVEIFPMLPEKLSTDMSSLRAGQDRLAIVIEFVVCKDGSLRRENVYRAFVRNKAKLIYEEIGDWLEGKGSIPKEVSRIPGLEDQVRIQDEAAKRLRKFREAKGALEFETIEAKPVVKRKEVKDLVIQHKNRARYLIENLMIAANGTMVRFLDKRGMPLIQRVVRTPRNWTRIKTIAESYGDILPSEPNPLALSQFLSRRKKADPERFPDLSLTIVKLLGAGEYVFVGPGKSKKGHFGLAVQDYTHSTAPNRRYVDVIIQRLIKSALDGKPVPYTNKELIEHAAWCSDRDKASKKVERFMRKVAAAVLLRNRIGEMFDAIVTGASDKGIYVRLLAQPVEGRVMSGGEGMEVGQKVRVRLVSVNSRKGYIDFEGEGRKKRSPRMTLKDRRRQKYHRRQGKKKRGNS